MLDHLDIGHVDDPNDPACDRFRDLRCADHPARAGHIIAEGCETVRWLLQSPVTVERLLLKPSLLPTLEPDCRARDQLPTVHLAHPRVMSAIAGLPVKRGVLACARRPQPWPLDRLRAHLYPHRRWRLLVCDAVHDPVNVGGVVRTARALGYDAVLLGPGCADPFYRRAVRCSVGHVFHLPLVVCADLVEVLRALRADGAAVYAAHRGPLSRSLDDIGSVPPRAALVIGNEDRGVSAAVVAQCDHLLTIPMAAGVDSLNVGVACGIIAHRLRGVGPDRSVTAG